MKVIKSIGKNLFAIFNFIGLGVASFLIHVPMPKVFNALAFYTVVTFIIMLLYLSNGVRERVFKTALEKADGDIFNNPWYRTRKAMYYSSSILAAISLSALGHFVLAGLWVVVLLTGANLYYTLEDLSEKNE